MEEQKKYYVYRFKDKEDNILYVGRTHNLNQRFRQHEHLTDIVKKIEYIECPTETDMVIKEIYYINLYFNENSTNVKDVYDKPTDYGFKDEWKKFEKVIPKTYQYTSTKTGNRNNGKNIDDYERIYVAELHWWIGEFIEPEYFTGVYDKDGFPEFTNDPAKAKRYSSIHSLKKQLIPKLKKLILKQYNTLEDYDFDIYPDIYLSKEIQHFLFNYYNFDKRREREKKLYFEDTALQMEQHCLMYDLAESHKTSDFYKKKFSEKIGEQYNSVAFHTKMSKYRNDLYYKIKDIELKRDLLKKDPEWQDHITSEEFAKAYIRNSFDAEQALDEVYKNRKLNYTLFPFVSHEKELERPIDL